MKNIKGTEPDSEKFKERSKTNTIQYHSTEQAVQHVLNAGMVLVGFTSLFCSDMVNGVVGSITSTLFLLSLGLLSSSGDGGNV